MNKPTGPDSFARVDTLMPVERPPLQQTVLVLQGGGALGAYQAGVFQALVEADIEPDWVIGTSIDSYSSEREDWIQNMVAGGLGICFIPEYSAVIPGLQVRPVIEPEVTRDVCLVTVAGRRFSPAVLTFVNAVKSYAWAEGPASISMQRTAA